MPLGREGHIGICIIVMICIYFFAAFLAGQLRPARAYNRLNESRRNLYTPKQNNTFPL